MAQSNRIANENKKQFEFSRYKQRHIALKLLYLGWDYDGLAEQANCDNTIEHHLFRALTTTCLVKSRQDCNYNRCGRTDKGVSSYGQVVDLDIRSNLLDENDPSNVGLFTPPEFNGQAVDCGKDQTREEINYIDTLNRVLPDHIRAIAWAPVDRKFSSRFDCQFRSYSYVFPKGDLCIESMEKSLQYLIGQHDFRNLCSLDLKNGVITHQREISDAKVKPIVNVGSNVVPEDCRYKYFELVIVGKAFLYHQIRCIMTILFLIGSRKESPELLRDLLDINKCPSKPNYNRASALPLCLFDCKYDADLTPMGWIHNQRAMFNVYKHLKKLWLQYKTKSITIEKILTDFENNHFSSREDSSDMSLNRWKDFGLEFDTMSDTKYISILKRPRDKTLESKLQSLTAKRQKTHSVLY